MSNTVKASKATKKMATDNVALTQINNPNNANIEALQYLSNEWRNSTKKRVMKDHGVSSETTDTDSNSFKVAMKEGRIMLTEGENLQYQADLIVGRFLLASQRLQNKFASHKAFK
tara:strand:+ start:2676 stop:3020 length:345 start_codon:yes stop_codon:yes gene_type:complete